MTGFDRHIFVCINERTPEDPRGSCIARGSREIQEFFKAEVKRRGLKGKVRANKAGCLDHCAFGPCVVIYPEGIWYTVKSLEEAREVLDRHIENGEVVQRLLMKEPPDKA